MKKSTNYCTFETVLKIPVHLVCGIDEAGRGPLAGPVAAAAAILSPDFPMEILNDSKRMSKARRENAFQVITEKALDWSVGWATVEEIEQRNILGATLLAMERAFQGLKKMPALVVVDGIFTPTLMADGAAVEAATMPKADGVVPAVMAASILAKVARDHCMDCLDQTMPGYGFRVHKGYPTRLHREAIAALGPSRYHRLSFQLLAQESPLLFDPSGE